MKTGISKESTLWKYHITDRLYNRAIDSEPEVSEKVKKCKFEKKKSSKTSTNIYLNAAVITWFKEAKDKGVNSQWNSQPPKNFNMKLFINNETVFEVLYFISLLSTATGQLQYNGNHLSHRNCPFGYTDKIWRNPLLLNFVLNVQNLCCKIPPICQCVVFLKRSFTSKMRWYLKFCILLECFPQR